MPVRILTAPLFLLLLLLPTGEEVGKEEGGGVSGRALAVVIVIGLGMSVAIAGGLEVVVVLVGEDLKKGKLLKKLTRGNAAPGDSVSLALSKE